MGLVLGIILVLTVIFTGLSMQSAPQDIRASAKIPTPTATPSPVQSPTPTLTPTSSPTPTPKPTPKTSPTATPAHNSQGAATDDALFNAINAYRSGNGKNSIAKNATLCRIAQTRATQQSSAGSLDNHAGFQGQAASQSEFHHVGEVLQYQSEPVTAEYLVYTGWATSGEHNAIILDPQWTHGCGAISGQFAVFIFARP